MSKQQGGNAKRVTKLVEKLGSFHHCADTTQRKIEPIEFGEANQSAKLQHRHEFKKE